VDISADWGESEEESEESEEEEEEEEEESEGEGSVVSVLQCSVAVCCSVMQCEKEGEKER